MIRWSNSDAYGLFAGLVEQAPIETRDQAALTYATARLRATTAELRRRDLQALWRVRVALLGIAFAALVLLVGLIDSPSDHVGPDELAHAQAWRQVVELRSSTAEVAR